MPRKVTKDASASASRSSSKRPAQETPSRQSKRARATTRKSYAEPNTDDEDDAVKKGSSTTDEDDVSEASGLSNPSDADPSSELEQEEATSDEDKRSKKLPSRGKVAQRSLPLHKKQGDDKELWKSGAKLTPGTQLIIKKPKARDAGDTPYADETIHPNTMLFLKDLLANNDRQWLKCKLIHLLRYHYSHVDSKRFLEDNHLYKFCVTKEATQTRQQHVVQIRTITIRFGRNLRL
jgi:hypothetical protein